MAVESALPSLQFLSGLIFVLKVLISFFDRSEGVLGKLCIETLTYQSRPIILSLCMIQIHTVSIQRPAVRRESMQAQLLLVRYHNQGTRGSSKFGKGFLFFKTLFASESPFFFAVTDSQVAELYIFEMKFHLRPVH